MTSLSASDGVVKSSIIAGCGYIMQPVICCGYVLKLILINDFHSLVATNYCNLFLMNTSQYQSQQYTAFDCHLVSTTISYTHY